MVERLLLRRSVEVGRGLGRVVEDLDCLIRLSGQEGKAREAALDARTVGLLAKGLERRPGRVQVADFEARVADDGDGADGPQVGLEDLLSLVDRLGPLVERHEIDREPGSGGDTAGIQRDGLLEGLRASAYCATSPVSRPFRAKSWPRYWYWLSLLGLSLIRACQNAIRLSVSDVSTAPMAVPAAG